jgi:hypothetical protein
MKITLGSFGSASICLRSSRSAAMHSMPEAVRADLAAHAEHQDVAGYPLERGRQRRRRCGHDVLEVLDVAEAIGERSRELSHRVSGPRRRRGGGRK